MIHVLPCGGQDHRDQEHQEAQVPGAGVGPGIAKDVPDQQASRPRRREAQSGSQRPLTLPAVGGATMAPHDDRCHDRRHEERAVGKHRARLTALRDDQEHHHHPDRRGEQGKADRPPGREVVDAHVIGP